MVSRVRLRSTHDELAGSARVLKRALNDPETPARDISALAREFRATLQALEDARPAAKDDPLDALAARRQTRRLAG